MICELVRQGKTVGVTANSHKVIRNLIDETIRVAEVVGLDLYCCQKAAEQRRLCLDCYLSRRTKSSSNLSAVARALEAERPGYGRTRTRGCYLSQYQRLTASRLHTLYDLDARPSMAPSTTNG